MIISRKPPYSATKADPEKSQGQINKLLRDYGASQTQWNSDYAKQTISLSFSFESEINGVKKLIGIKCSPPIFAAQHRQWNPKTGRNEKIYAPNWAQSYRLMYWWLKAKIEAVSYGMTTIEQEFLSQVIVNLPSGETTTIGKAIMETAVLSSGQFVLEDKNINTHQSSYSHMIKPPQIIEADIIESEESASNIEDGQNTKGNQNN